MDNPINNPPESIPGGANVTPAGGSGNGADAVSLKDLTKDLIGREYPTDEAAASAIKETYSAVGWAPKYKPVLDQLRTRFGSDDAVLAFLQNGGSAPQAAPADTKQFVSREQYDTDTFFATNPQYAPYRELIVGLRKGDEPLTSVVAKESFKTTFEAAEAHKQTEKSRSVVHSNPRLGQATDKISKAREAVAQGNFDAAADAAVSAVTDLIEK